jgi:diguanylate cyclase (GGDEF)-like protein
MSEALDILRSYASLVTRLAGAEAVSLYVPPGAAGEREILVQVGETPLPELADAETAAAFHARASGGAPGPQQHLTRLASEDDGGVLYRIPLHWVVPCDDAPGVERRKATRLRGGEPEAWLGLRFATASQAGERTLVPSAAEALRDDDWWNAFLGLGAAFAVHTRAVARRLQDQVTGLPDRREFQNELEAAIAQSRPTVLLLIGPDDFGWVNERLDRRSGDRVLREIALGLRAAVRRQDHVARYGGAIFTVLLRDSTLEEGRRVAENVVRRLGEERYHQRLLRLEFSAGVAYQDPADPIDAHELVRRADQALSAAKRGQAGNVRVWEKGSDVELARSLDRLQGIFTGDKSKDYRNMTLLLDTVAAVAASTDPADLACGFTERLFETLRARRALVVGRSPGGDTFELLAGLERDGAAGQLQLGPRDLSLLEEACRQRDIVTHGGQQPGEPILCALPLMLQERCLGGILLEVTSDDVSLEGSDRQFLDALASEMAVALDRARLAERERRREHEEKERLFAEVQDLRRVLHGSRLVYASAAMESLLATARKVARTDTTVLITGESGTGKEMLAHTLHELSERRERPMVVVDCSSIAPTLIESELFGHEKGAFTGAHARNPGRLAQAHGATVFLDEIGDLPLDLQSKLLRFVQDKQFTPVGGVTARRVDARILAATNVDLRARVAQGRFREDLFHRLNVVRLHVPALRERKDDVLHLANVFLKQFAALYRRPAHHFTPAAEKALLEHPWPGNVRELQNVVLTSALFCERPEVDVADLQLHRDAPAASPLDTSPSGAERMAGAPAEPAAGLRQALAREIAAVLASGRPPVPLGKWLAEDLILAADRLSGGTHRKGSELLGLPETTYRRQLQNATRHHAAGLAVRSPSWPAVAGLLEDLIRSLPSGRDVCAWAEACLLTEIDSVTPGDVRTAAALVGVTETTVLRRTARLRRS